MSRWEKDSAEEYVCGRAGNHPVLSHREEIDIIPKAQGGDKAAWRKVMACNPGLVMHIAHRYINNGLDYADLVQEGNIGMIRAVEKWDPKRGYRFSTYAGWWIGQACRRAIMYQSRTVRLPVSLEAALVKVQRAWSDSMTTQHETLTTLELAERAKISVDKVRYCKQFFHSRISLDDPIGDDSTYTPAMGLKSNLSTEATVEAAFDKQKIQEWIRALKPKDRMFIVQRFGLLEGDEPKTRQQIAQKYETTEEDIQNWEIRILDKLRQVANKASLNCLLEGEPIDPPIKKGKRQSPARAAESE